MSDTRLIERWLPIAALGEESVRERRSMTALPPTYYLHVWWARRPLVAARAAVLASLLPADADRERFLHVLGIHGDPVATKHRIDAAKRNKTNLGPNPYGYKRAFTYLPSNEDRSWIKLATGHSLEALSVLDPTAGGGSIPIETERIGFTSIANDLNPVAALILKATVEWPMKHGFPVIEQFQELGREFIHRAEPKYERIFPAEPKGVQITGYLWARTITCPYCDGLVPLSPNWRLAPDGTGVRLKPGLGPGAQGRVCSFEIVKSTKEQPGGTVLKGVGSCPYPDCGRVIDGAEIKRQAQAGQMGEQLFAVVYKRTRQKDPQIRKTRQGQMGPGLPGAAARGRQQRRNSGKACREAGRSGKRFDMVPSEKLRPIVSIDDRSKIQYGMSINGATCFLPRQLLCHGTSVEVFREMLDADREKGKLTGVRQAAYGYLALTLDTLLNYNNRACDVGTIRTGRGRGSDFRPPRLLRS